MLERLWAGAGLNLNTTTPTPEQMRNAIQELLANGRYRQAAARLQADYVRHNAPEEAARC